MRRRDLAWLAIFPDPPTRLSRPLSKLEASAYVILKNDEFPIPWSGVDRTAHVKDAYLKWLFNFQEKLREYTDRTPPHQKPQDNSHLDHVPEAELAAEHDTLETSAGNATGRSPIS
jgi:hypothetical protein